MSENQTTAERVHIAKALNNLAYAPHEESWAKDEWPRFLPHADAVLTAMRETTPPVNRADGFRLAARLNEAFRRHCGLSGYVHASNRIEHEHCMYDAMEELGLLPKEAANG